MSAQKQYNDMLESGDLLEIYPGLVGNWQDDKDTFIEYYELNLKAINEIDVNFEEEYGQ